MRILQTIVDGGLKEHSSIGFAHDPLLFAKIADRSHAVRFGYQPDCGMRWLCFLEISLAALEILMRDKFLNFNNGNLRRCSTHFVHFAVHSTCQMLQHRFAQRGPVVLAEICCSVFRNRCLGDVKRRLVCMCQLRAIIISPRHRTDLQEWDQKPVKEPIHQLVHQVSPLQCFIHRNLASSLSSCDPSAIIGTQALHELMQRESLVSSGFDERYDL